MRHIAFIALSLLLSLAAPMSWAQESALSEEQQQRLVGLIEDGKSAYDQGKFQGALELFRQAYDIYPHPDILYRIALCHERLDEPQQAVQFYRQFLREVPDADDRGKIERTIEMLESRIAKSEIRITTQPDQARVYIDDVANGAAGYTPTALAVKPGNYQLIIQKDGYETVRELVTVGAGQQVQVRYQLTELETEEPADAGTKRAVPSVMFLTLASIGVASAVTAVVFFNLHANKRDEIEQLDAMPRQDVPRSAYERVQNQARTNLIVAVSATAVSAFSLIWAYGVWVSDTSQASAAAPVLQWSEDGPIVGYRLRF